MRTINLLNRRQVGGFLLASAILIITLLIFSSKVKEQEDEIDKLKNREELLSEELDKEKALKDKLKNDIVNKKDKIETLTKEKENLKQESDSLKEEKTKLEKEKKELENKLSKRKPTPAPVNRGSSRARSNKKETTSSNNKRLLGTFEVTAYTDDVQSQGKWVGKTASGMKPQVGVVAVDPKVIPLGTKLYVEGYGECVAGDTGGAIKGNIIDVFFNTRKECRSWGRKKKKVYIIE